MNNLQKIEEVFGEHFCPLMSVRGKYENYAAVLRSDSIMRWQSPLDLKNMLAKAETMGMRVGIDIGRRQYDIYFN